MQAQEAMTTRVSSVAPDTPEQENAPLMIEHRSSAVQGIARSGQRAGIVSEHEHADPLEGGDRRGGGRAGGLGLVGTDEEQAHAHLQLHGRVAREIMTTPVLTVEPTTSVADVAHLLETRQIKRVPVVAGGRVLGLVTRG